MIQCHRDCECCIGGDDDLRSCGRGNVMVPKSNKVPVVVVDFTTGHIAQQFRRCLGQQQGLNTRSLLNHLKEAMKHIIDHDVWRSSRFLLAYSHPIPLVMPHLHPQ